MLALESFGVPLKTALLCGPPALKLAPPISLDSFLIVITIYSALLFKKINYFSFSLHICCELLALGDLQSMLPRKQKLEDRLKELTHRADIMVFMKGDPDVSRDM